MKIRTKNMTICAMFCALIVIGAFIKIDIPLPLYTMHFTLQWLFVMMAAFILGSKLGCLSVFTYVCLGLLGLLERSFMKKIGATCHDPIGAYASFDSGVYVLNAIFGTPDLHNIAFAKSGRKVPGEDMVDELIKLCIRHSQ